MSPVWSPGRNSIIGQSITPSASLDFSLAGTDNQIALTSITMPEAGTLLSISVFMAGHTAAINAQGCLWSNTGALLIASTSQSIINGSHVSGGQVWTTFLATLALINAEILYIGFFRDKTQDAEWSVQGSGSFVFGTSTANAPDTMANPPAACGGAYICGSPGAYITYAASDFQGPSSQGDGTW